MRTKVDTEKEQHKDPVCKMVASGDSEYYYHYADKYYYFCSKHCMHKFKEHPEQYLEKENSPSFEAQGELITYTCPMHPDIQQQAPGNCPKCGMALERATVSIEEKNKELIDMRVVAFG